MEVITMSEFEIYQLPKDQIYWKKSELEDKIFALSKRLNRLKNKEKQEQIKESIIYLCNSIKKIDNRMSQLYM